MNNIWCILIPILAALFGALFGWLLKTLFCNCDDEKNEIESLKNKKNKLEADLKACLAKKPIAPDTSELDSLKLKNSDLETKLRASLANKIETSELDKLKIKNNNLQTELNACLASKSIQTPINSITPNLVATADPINTEPPLNFNAGLAKAVFGKKIIGDDLKVVEGIGPKISELFHTNGITTWYQLSQASIERCQQVLDTGGKRYEIHNPSTWPKQAGLAFEGKWEELNTLQDRLDGGVDRG